MLKLNIQRFRLERLNVLHLNNFQRCITNFRRSTPFNLRSIANLCLLIIAIFTFHQPVNCQDIDQIHSIREIYHINSYKNAQIFRYYIPEDTSIATWTFIGNTSLNCDYVNVFVYLRWRGIPVINFDNTTDHDVLIDNDQQFKFEFKANNQKFKFNLTNPLSGEYYGLVYFNKVLTFNDVGDQVLNSILEKTEIFDCRAWLNSYLSFNRIKSVIKINFGNKHTDHIHNAKLFQFFVPLNVFSLNVNITKCKPIERNSQIHSNGQCPISLYLRGSGLPTRELNDRSIHCTDSQSCHLKHLDPVRNDFNYLVIELQNTANLDKNFINGVHISFIIHADNCHDNVPLDDYLSGIPMIMTTSTTISPQEEEESISSTQNQNLFIAKKRVPESIYTTESTTSSTTTERSTTTTTTTTTERPTTTSTTTTTTTTTTTPKPTTPPTTTTTTTTQPSTTIRLTTTTEKQILRNKKPIINPLQSSIQSTTTIRTTSTENYNNNNNNKLYNIYNSKDIAAASSDNLMNYYSKLPKIKQPTQKKDSYPININNNKLHTINKPTFDKEYNENLELNNNNKEDKDDDEENEAEDEEDEENEEDEEIITNNKHHYRNQNNRNQNNKNYQLNKPNQRNQYRNQFNNKQQNHMKYNNNFNNQRHHKQQQKNQEDDDDIEIQKFTNERNRKNQNEYDFTRQNLRLNNNSNYMNSRSNRISRAIWQLENSIFQNELSKINFVEQCPFVINFHRVNLPGNFNFQYSQHSTTNLRSSQTFIQIPNTNINHQLDERSMRLSLVSFELVPLLDTGGSLDIELGLNIDFDYQVNNVSVVACISYNRIPVSLNNCMTRLQVNSSILNQNRLSKTLIPYPKSGHWFISLIAFCHKDTVFPHHGLSGQSNPIGQETRDCDRKYSSIYLNIKSESCNENRCNSKRGICKNQLQNGLVFSYCECRPGYRGFECKEEENNNDEEVQQQLLIELLVLSLSNLLWMPVIIIAIYKLLWIESLVYLLTMLLSASFHFCSSTSSYSMCLINPLTLEFGCLFISCLCICITLISLSDMGLSLKCTLHMFAAIWTTLLIHLEWSPFWMYTISSILFSLIMLTSWLVNCCRGSCFPSCKLWFFSIIPAFTTLTSAFAVLLYPPILLPKWIVDSIFNILLPISVLFLIYSINNKGKVMISESNSLQRVNTRAKDGQLFGNNKGISSDTYYSLISEGTSHLARNPLK